MRISARARLLALSLLAALAGSVSVGVAALARAGFCLHRLGALGLSASAGATGPAGTSMPGMAMPATAGVLCPILVGIALFGAVCYLLALVGLIALRPTAGELLVSSARAILGLRFTPLVCVLTAVGAVPVGAAIVADGAAPLTALLVAAAFLAIGATLLAVLLSGAARLVVALARRVVARLCAALRLGLAGALPPLPLRLSPPLAAAGVRVARRRPSRAPPVCG